MPFMACLAPPPAVSSIQPGIVDHHARSSDHAANQNVVEAQGYDVIYGDTDSTFVWLKVHIRKKKQRKSVVHWCSTLRLVGGNAAKTTADQRTGTGDETHFCRFLMPTIRGADTGSKSATPD